RAVGVEQLLPELERRLRRLVGRAHDPVLRGGERDSSAEDGERRDHQEKTGGAPGAVRPPDHDWWHRGRSGEPIATIAQSTAVSGLTVIATAARKCTRPTAIWEGSGVCSSSCV